MREALQRIAYRLGLRADEVEVLLTISRPTPTVQVVEVPAGAAPVAVMVADAWLTDGATQPPPRPTRALAMPALGVPATTPQ